MQTILAGSPDFPICVCKLNTMCMHAEHDVHLSKCLAGCVSSVFLFLCIRRYTVEHIRAMFTDKPRSQKTLESDLTTDLFWKKSLLLQPRLFPLVMGMFPLREIKPIKKYRQRNTDCLEDEDREITRERQRDRENERERGVERGRCIERNRCHLWASCGILFVFML